VASSGIRFRRVCIERIYDDSACLSRSVEIVDHIPDERAAVAESPHLLQSRCGDLRHLLRELNLVLPCPSAPQMADSL
jgi:hypothetical protein